MKPSPVPAALLAVLVLLWLPLLLVWPWLPRTPFVYRGLDAVHGATLLASAAFLALEAVRARGRLRLAAAVAAALAVAARFLGVRELWFLLRHGLADVWALGVPAVVGLVLAWIARRRAAAGG